MTHRFLQSLGGTLAQSLRLGAGMSSLVKVILGLCLLVLSTFLITPLAHAQAPASGPGGLSCGVATDNNTSTGLGGSAFAPVALAGNKTCLNLGYTDTNATSVSNASTDNFIIGIFTNPSGIGVTVQLGSNATNVSVTGATPSAAGNVFTLSATTASALNATVNFSVGGFPYSFPLVKPANSNSLNAFTVADLTPDTTAPSTSVVSIASNNVKTSTAVVGSTITLSMTFSEDLATGPTVTIAGQAATVTGSAKNWSASTLVTGSTPKGAVAFNISGYKDAANNTGAAATATTDGSSMKIGVLPTAPSNLTLLSVLSPSPSFGLPHGATLTEPSVSWTQGSLNDTADTVHAPVQLGEYSDGTCTTFASGTGFLFGQTEANTLLNRSPTFTEGSTASLNLRYENDFGFSPYSNCVSFVIPPSDTTAPTVTSVVRKTPSGANTGADSLTWTTTFSEGVRNLDLSDFSFSNTTATATVTKISDSVYDITASGGDLANLASGTVGLVFASGQNIADLTNANNLSNTTPSGANETYNVTNDVVDPRVTSIIRKTPTSQNTNADSLTWTVTFSEDVQNVDVSDFTSTVSPTNISIDKAVTAISASVYEVTFSGAALAAVNSSQVSLGFLGAQNIADTSGRTLKLTTPTGTNENNYNVSNTGPKVASIQRIDATTGAFAGQHTNNDSLRWRITFSEIGNAFSLAPTDFALTGTTATLSVSRFSIGFDVTATGGDLANLNGDVSLAFASNTPVDEFGNNFTDKTPTGVNEVLFTVDNIAPTVTSIDLFPGTVSPTDADRVSWGVTFSEPILRSSIDHTDFAISATTGDLGVNEVSNTYFDVQLANGNVANFNGNVALSFATAGKGRAFITDLAGNQVASFVPTGTNNNQITILNDQQAPQAVFSSLPATANGPFDLNLSFTENVSGLTASDFIVENATVTLSGGPENYTLTVTPDGTGNISISLPANVATDAAGNGNEAFFETINVEVDTTAPVATVVDPPTSANGPFDLTFTFTEDMTGLEASDFVVTNGTLTLSGGPKVFTATVTPDGTGEVSVNLPANSATDPAGNGNEAFNANIVVQLDTKAPEVAASEPPEAANGPFDLTFTFTEEMTGLEASDFIVTNGTLTLSGGPKVFIATVTPDGTGEVSVSLPANSATDPAGNGNEAINSAVSVNYDAEPPQAEPVDPPAVVNGAFELTYSFSEDVTGLEASDFIVENATVTLSGGPRDFILTVTPDDTGDVSVELPANVATDAAGNGNASQSTAIKIEVDKEPPTVAINVPDLPQGESFEATFEFSEAVIGFTQEDIEVENATVSNFQTGSSTKSQSSLKPTGSQKGDTIFSATITPTGEGKVKITVKPDALGDIAGNLNVVAQEVEVIVDTTAPNVVIADLPADVRGPFTIFIDFDEDVTGFEQVDISLVNGAATEFLALNPRQYSALITPLQRGTVTIDVKAGAAADLSGNLNNASQPVSTEYIDEAYVQQRTSRIIHNFMAKRADQITLNAPNLAQRLLSEGTSGRINGQADHDAANIGFSGKASGERARLDKVIGADAASRVSLWTEAKLASISAETTDSDLFLLHVGGDYRLNENTLIGLMGQYDTMNEKDQTEAFDISGDGWMVGPYVVSRLSDNLVFDGSATWGKSNNEVKPFKSYKDEFDTNRWFLKGQLTGDFQVQDWNINPNLAVIYFEETQKSYQDSLGITIPEQTINLGRVTFGPNVSKPVKTSDKVTVTTNFGVKGIWDFEKANIVDLNTGLHAQTGSLRARTEGGFSASFATGTRLNIDAFYDGIGADDYEAYGVKAGVSFVLN